MLEKAESVTYAVDCKPLLHLTHLVQASRIVSTVIVMTSLGSLLMEQPPCLGHRKMYSISSMECLCMYMDNLMYNIINVSYMYPLVSGIQMNMKMRQAMTTPANTKKRPAGWRYRQLYVA